MFEVKTLFNKLWPLLVLRAKLDLRLTKSFFIQKVDCNFEDGICNFIDLTNDDSATFVWTIQNSRSLKDLGQTGPQTDSSGSEEGQYIFVSGNLETRKTTLRTELMSSKILGGTNCLTFEFDLSVNIKRIFWSNKTDTAAWHSKGFTWHFQS